MIESLKPHVLYSDDIQPGEYIGRPVVDGERVPGQNAGRWANQRVEIQLITKENRFLSVIVSGFGFADVTLSGNVTYPRLDGGTLLEIDNKDYDVVYEIPDPEC